MTFLARNLAWLLIVFFGTSALAENPIKKMGEVMDRLEERKDNLEKLSNEEDVSTLSTAPSAPSKCKDVFRVTPSFDQIKACLAQSLKNFRLMMTELSSGN